MAYIQSDEDDEIVADTLREFSEMQMPRYVFASHWEEVSELIDPISRNTFQYGNYNWPGQKKTDRQVDARGMVALSTFVTICDSIMTPANSRWHGLRSRDPYVMKDRATRLYFEQLTNLLFEYRYFWLSGFIGQNQAKYRSIGAYGNSGLFIDALDESATGFKGLRYKAISMGELFFKNNHQGMVDTVIRWMRMTARQIKQKWPDTFPASLQPALDQGSEQFFDVLHHVYPNAEYEKGRYDKKGKRYRSCYVSMTSKTLLQEGAYSTFPYEIQKYNEGTAQEVYGRSPAMDVLPALKTLNAEKRVFLKQGHRAGDPVLLTYDDGLLSFDMTPGAMNPGGMNSDGKPLVGILPSGNIQITKEMMDEESELINDVFLVTLFKVLQDNPQMSATQAIELINQKGILLGPNVGRLRPDQMVFRELSVLEAQKLLPPMPPRLKEAGGITAAGVIYSSPLFKAMQAQEAAGFFRTIEGVKELVAVTQDQSLLDPFDFPNAIAGIADTQSVPESWMAGPDKQQAKAKARADAAQRQQMIQAAPAAASMMKARAAAGLSAAPAQSPAQPGSPLTG